MMPTGRGVVADVVEAGDAIGAGRGRARGVISRARDVEDIAGETGTTIAGVGSARRIPSETLMWSSNRHPRQ